MEHCVFVTIPIVNKVAEFVGQGTFGDDVIRCHTKRKKKMPKKKGGKKFNFKTRKVKKFKINRNTEKTKSLRFYRKVKNLKI